MTRALLATAVLAFASSVATADTITVCLDGSCDYTDIQSAINAASDGDVIEIAAGIYYPAETINTLGKAVTLRGEVGKGKGDAPTTIDGQDSIQVLRCTNGEGADTVFENLLITGGWAEGSWPDNSGGGMYCSGSSPTLTGCTFTNNSAAFAGGGMSNYDSSPTLTNCTFENNSANYSGGMDNWASSPTLTGCTFTDNSAGNYGGGMYNFKSSLTLIDCTFTGNSAESLGGGMFSWDSSPTLTNTILCSNTPDQVFGSWTDISGNCLSFSCADDDGDGVPDKCGGKGRGILLVPSEYPTIESAIAAAAYGDVIEIAAGTYQPAETLNTQGKPITLRGTTDGEGNPTTIIDGQGSRRVLQCTSGEGADTVFENLLITGGYTSGSGGGMRNIPGSSPTLRNCTFLDNSADDGGGMYNYASRPTLENCTFADNSADYGGGLYNDYYSSPTLTGCVFEGNSVSSSGGGMYNLSSSPKLTGCVFTECCQVYPPNSFIDKGGNDYDSWCDECRANVDCVGEVDAADLGLLLSAWNTTEAQYDIDGDGVVGGGDLGMLLGTWGACP